MKDIIKIFISLIIAILLIDLISFYAWVLSGQQPNDEFYFGTMTSKVIRYFYQEEDGFNGRNYIPYNQFNPETGELIK